MLTLYHTNFTMILPLLIMVMILLQAECLISSSLLMWENVFTTRMTKLLQEV